MAIIDYLTVSLGHYKKNIEASTEDILHIFAGALPDTYKNTCRDLICSEGKSMRVSQCGICVSLQYGSALLYGWVYSVQISGDYWQAIEYKRESVLDILERFTGWRVSRLDLARNACVPLKDWCDYYKAVFEIGDYTINGASDARTIYYGSRKSQFYTRIYNKTAEDGKHFPAPVGSVQIRFEIEIKYIRGELILEPAFLDSKFADNLFIQRVRHIAENDVAGFIKRYFDSGDNIDRVETVKRVVGDFERTVDFVFRTYAPYISAGLKSEATKNKFKDLNDTKVKKILAVLEHNEK